MTSFITIFQPAPSFSFVIHDHEIALHFRNGSHLGVLTSGKHRFWTAGHEVKRVDTREQMILIQGQELLTADQVAVKLSVVAVYRVADALTMHRASADPLAVLYVEIQLALRQIVAAENAEAFLQLKSGHGARLLPLIADRAAALGLKVDRIDIRDVMLPAELKRSYMAVLQQRQESSAVLEKARSETAALRSLANAAKLMRDNPELLSLRYLQTIQEIGTSVGNTLVLGLTDSEKLHAAMKS
ncbi:slipin family protein [Prosthecobacter sp.]|uniref:slipin family protein n=1 Tax=Prosthecobacter sp. TaxID=1965333 RepID=UPI002486FFBB|nr:slipin family protein [Prosthecobacter sp.]MDI1312433.1 slipin family protein [Prosthecobacter sp.]